MDLEARQRAMKVRLEGSADAEEKTRQYLEQHYRIVEVAKAFAISRDTATRLFKNEPGVLRLNLKSKKRSRVYATLLIPQHVVERVRRRLAL